MLGAADGGDARVRGASVQGARVLGASVQAARERVCKEQRYKQQVCKAQALKQQVCKQAAAKRGSRRSPEGAGRAVALPTGGNTHPQALGFTYKERHGGRGCVATRC